MEDKVKEIILSSQDTISNHQRNILKLEKIYSESDFEAFTNILFKCIKHMLLSDLQTNNSYSERAFDFLGKFISSVTEKYEKAQDSQELLSEDSIPSEPLLTFVITNVLMCNDHIDLRVRYNSCRLISLIMTHLKCDLSDELCDMIQDAMLERLKDPKPIIRIQAIKALERLQQPQDPNCPVLKGLISAFCDTNAQVRKEIVRYLAPSPRHKETITFIEEKTRDTDAYVRMVAFQKCSDIGPKLFRIVSRQNILISGFNDRNKTVKKVFNERLLSKWLTYYNGNFLEFMRSIKLDADENDIFNTQIICEKAMEVFFRTNALKEFINALPTENKLIPIAKLTSEAVLYWSILTDYFKNLEDEDEYLSEILPELTPFCNYIESIIKAYSAKTMEKWEFLEYQHILLILFQMADNYDLSDELGRKTLKSLVLSILEKHTFEYKVVCLIIKIAAKLIPDVGIFTNEICQIISEIRDPFVEKPLETIVDPDYEVKMAKLRVRLNILENDKEEAVEKQEYKKAQEIHEQIQKVTDEIDQLTLPMSQGTQKVRENKSDPGTICRCLDILAATLQTSTVKAVTSSLDTVRSEFLMPLMTSLVEEINWRVLRCLNLYCIIDKKLAEENAKFISIPIATYHNDYNRQALMTSIAAVTDMIRIYGSDLFGSNDKTNVNQTTRGRILYRDEDAIEELTTIENNLTLEYIVEIILDMLDDETEEIKDAAFMAIAKLVLNGFSVSHTLMSRLILKWYNPVSGGGERKKLEKRKRVTTNEKSEDKLQQKIGWMINEYAAKVKGSKEVIEKSVIPTLNTIANAPSTSPLADIDVDNVIKFLSVLTIGGNGVVHLHGSLAESICHKIISKPLDSDVPYLTKMLRCLEPPPNDSTRNELLKLAELLLQEEYGLEKNSRKHVMQYIAALTIRNGQNDASHTNNLTTDVTANSNNNTEAITTANCTEIESRTSIEPGEKPTRTSSINGSRNSLDSISTINNTLNGTRKSLNGVKNATLCNGARKTLFPIVEKKQEEEEKQTVVEESSGSSDDSTRRRSTRKKARMEKESEKKMTKENEEPVEKKTELPVVTRNKKRQRKEVSPASSSENEILSTSTRSKSRSQSNSTPLSELTVVSATSSSKSTKSSQNTSVRRSTRKRVKKTK